ncbi:hypothetical protein QAD02_011573 [Eretmocerus hayati]|uniref:Uncharacterized protein n=1 Tax=Eretmocerus hayati TaxID=131215 RepID=A0ACC2NXE1_9HYME|nr:hypothetical protein QAD02_011573 [Eretmocerus hayati]
MTNNGKEETIVVEDLGVLLKQTLDEQSIVKDYQTKTFLTLGDNFAGSIFKIIVTILKTEDYSSENLYLIGKKIDPSITFFDWDILFKKEVFMYTDIIPLYESIENMILSNSTSTIAQCIPKMYGSRISLDPKAEKVDADAIILLEDLKVQGCYLLDKKIGLDMKHAIVAIRTLARFHALGIVAKNKHPEEFENIKLQSLKSGYFGYLAVEPVMLEPIKNSPRFSKYSDRIQELVEKITVSNDRFDLMRQEPWITIIHHDYWTNNLMFHANETGEIDGFKFIDFQGYNYANIFVDLPYFLCCSLDEDTMLNHIDELLDIYYESFIDNLRRNFIDTNQFSRDEFDDRLRKDAQIEFLRCNMALSFFTIEITGDMNAEDVRDKIVNCKSDLYFRKLDNLFKVYLKKGWFYD